MRLKIYFGGDSPICGAGVRPYLIRRPAIALKNHNRDFAVGVCQPRAQIAIPFPENIFQKLPKNAGPKI